MRRKWSSIWAILAAFVLLATMLAACAPADPGTDVEEPAAEEPGVVEEEPAAEEPAAEGEAVGCEGTVVGVSNGFVGSEWRSQMLEDLEVVAEELGMELIVESAD